VRFSSTNCFFHFFNRKDANYISSGNINIPGCCSSGAGYFFWNKGVIKVNTGLAIMNNALIPVGLIVLLYGIKRQILRRF
jgi:drug/metabolite transporter (DMT)-like permease